MAFDLRVKSVVILAFQGVFACSVNQYGHQHTISLSC